MADEQVRLYLLGQGANITSPAVTPAFTSSYQRLEELDRKADRLMDAFAESADMPPAYLQRSLARLDQERQTVLEAQRREQKRPVMPAVLDFLSLSFEEKKAVAAQFIRRVEVAENSAEIIWIV